MQSREAYKIITKTKQSNTKCNISYKKCPCIYIIANSEQGKQHKLQHSASDLNISNYQSSQVVLMRQSATVAPELAHNSLPYETASCNRNSEYSQIKQRRTQSWFWTNDISSPKVAYIQSGHSSYENGKFTSRTHNMDDFDDHWYSDRTACLILRWVIQ